MSIGKSRPFGDSHDGGRFAGGHGHDRSLTLGAIGDRFAGFLSIGRHGTGSDLHGGLLSFDRHDLHDLDDHHLGLFSFDGHHGHHGHHAFYSPFYHSFAYGYPYYSSYFGYGYGYPYDSFLSGYYAAPYTYPYVGVNYYIDAIADAPTTAYDSTVAPDYTFVPDAPSAGASTAPAAPLTALDKLLRDGQADLAAGRYEEARRAFAHAMFVDEKDGVVKLLYAIASFGEGDYDLASIALRKALSAEPGLIDRPADVLALWPDRFEFQTRLDRLADLIGKNGAQTERKLLLGYLYFGSGRPDEARALFDAIVQHSPGDALAERLRDAAAASVKP